MLITITSSVGLDCPFETLMLQSSLDPRIHHFPCRQLTHLSNTAFLMVYSKTFLGDQSVGINFH